MVDEFAEEISSSLNAGGRPASGAAPTILLGLGQFGSACLDHIFQNLDPLPKKLVALSVLADDKLDEGVSFLSEENRLFARVPGAGGSRASICREFLVQGRSMEKWLEETATNLLAQPEIGDQSGGIKVFIISRAEEIDASALAIAFPEMVKRALGGLVSNWPVAISGFILLPKGHSMRGAQVFPLVTELQNEDPGYDRVFLVSEANPGGLVGQEGSIDLISEFAGLMLEPDFAAAVADLLNMTAARFAGFGISSIVHPAERIIADESARFTRELINLGLLSSGGEPFYRLADEYVKTERLKVENFYKKLSTDVDGRVFDRIDIDSLVLTNVSLAFWPDRIASYAAFLGQERIPALIKKIENNLADLSIETSAGLRAKIDELMSEPSALEKTRHFISRLSERVDELKTESERRKQEIIGRIPDLRGYHDKLAKQIKNLPSLAAIVSRSSLMAVLVFFFALRFTYILRRLPNRYIDPIYVPAAVPTAVFAVIVVATLTWLVYRRAENGLFKARDMYVNAIGDKYRLAVSQHAFQLLGWWLADKSEDELAERRLSSLKETIVKEQAAVVKISKFYLQINDILKTKPVNIDETRVRRSVFSAFGRQANLRYKKGRYNLSDEIQQFTVSGHEGWRELELSELSKRLDEFCRRGLAFVDNRSLDRLFLDFGRGGGVMTTVIDDLRRLSQPYIAISTSMPRTTELVGICGGTQSALVSQTALAGQAAVVPIWSAHRVAFVQLVCPIKIEQLAAYSAWRQAYELEADKSDLWCPKPEADKGKGDDLGGDDGVDWSEAV